VYEVEAYLSQYSGKSMDNGWNKSRTAALAALADEVAPRGDEDDEVAFVMEVDKI